MTKGGLAKLVLLGLTLASAVAWAAPVIPEKTGWSGYINLGVSAGTSKSNMVSEITSVDLGKDRISSLQGSPGSEDVVLPAIEFELAYTLGDSLTQFYLGTQVADYLTCDMDTTLETHLGIRQHIDEFGTISISVSGSSSPTKVWKDPYVTGSKRGDTERTSIGMHMGWDRIFGTPLEFIWSSSEIKIDDESSGKALGLSKEDQRLLRRKGNVNRLKLGYEWQISERHQLVPAIGYLDFDLNGDAYVRRGCDPATALSLHTGSLAL